jgi:hypothetical protein
MKTILLVLVLFFVHRYRRILEERMFRILGMCAIVCMMCNNIKVRNKAARGIIYVAVYIYAVITVKE